MTHGSLFHGAGLLAMGLEQAGFETLWTLDILYGQDITKENAAQYKRVDLISGGPPCINTSFAKGWQGKEARTLQSLWPEMLRFIFEIRPTWALVEQPLGGKSIILQAAQELQRLGYGCAGRVVDSKHWVPQQRARWFLIGRMGIDGLALGNYLYNDMQRRKVGVGRCAASEQGQHFVGSCPNCLRGGVFTRGSTRKVAFMGAGNGVSVPVARYLGERIIGAEREISET